MSDLLRDQVVAITGSGRGIGRACALAAAAEGAKVVVNDIDADTAENTAAEITAAGGEALVSGHDVADWDGAAAMVDLAVTGFGRIDALMNNAGELRVNRPEDETRETAEVVVRASLMATIACTTHALPHMRAAGRGVILNVTSGQQMGASAMAVYGAAKAGTASLTYTWSQDLLADGIRVNAMSPNAHTRLADRFEDFLGQAATGQNEGKTPESNTALALYLLSDLSNGVTGQVIRQDGQSLMVCTHPAVIGPPAFLREGFTADDVAAVVATELADKFQPTGIRQVMPPTFL